MINIKNKKVLVTGSQGFFGRHVCQALEQRGAEVIRVEHKYWNLIYADVAYYLLTDYDPDYVIHLAANTGGIVYNKNNPATLFHDNILINTNVLSECAKQNVKKVVNVTTSCSYPDGLEILREAEYWNGKPNPSVEYFGIAKKASESFGRALHKQYGLNVVTACVTNLYGPHDNFTENGKVVSNLIRKFVRAKQEDLDEVVCLGTGNPKREFMHVTNAAEALVRTLESYEDPSLPLNIGVGYDISIAQLADLIKNLVGYEGKITWDTSAGDGQMKKLLDVSRMHKILDYYSTTPLDEGLKETIEWYINNKGN